jgi:hypothetical protein
MTREKWATEFLKELGAPVTMANLHALVSWIQAEGGDASWNPLNTTLDADGATEYNWVGVKNYPDFATGITATVETLNYGADHNLYEYKPIRHNLMASRRAGLTLRAVEASTWGTGGLALRCLPWVKKSWNSYSSQPIASK